MLLRSARWKDRRFLNVTPSKEPRKFNVVCAWCGRVETPATPGGSKAAPSPALPVSHTICDTCFARERAEVERVVRMRRKKSSA